VSAWRQLPDHARRDDGAVVSLAFSAEGAAVLVANVPSAEGRGALVVHLGAKELEAAQAELDRRYPAPVAWTPITFGECAP
jgi:hypothetical protein